MALFDLVGGLDNERRANDEPFGALERADDHDMFGQRFDESEMGPPVDRAQAAMSSPSRQ